MGLAHSPKIVTDGLIFAYDMSNGKSNIGAPAINTLPNPALNGLPTYGNGWGTYNTNQYGSGTYFSIGTVSSISDNIVNMSSAHSLRTYDVMQPQTTGGGVTAGTNYLIKRLSSTSFSLHPYNSSQDGSQGYINPATGTHKVYDDFANDVRISINSSEFPTMWWGYPHLPNSGLVKEIIPRGFTGIPGRTPTDCIRLHYIRSEGLDGMAYGPDGVVTAGNPWVVSFWARAVTPSAVGVTNSYQIYNYGVVSPTGYYRSFTLGDVGVWQKYTLEFTPANSNCISYWFPGTGNMKYDIANIQFESGSVSSNFVAGTRLANNNLESTPSYPTWNQSAGVSSGGTLTFSTGSYNSKGTWDLYKTYSGLSTGTNYTWSALVKLGTATNLLVTMHNTQAWNTGPSAVFAGELSTNEFRRVSITGTTNTGSFNLHLGASFNTELASTVQSGGTIFIQDVRLVLSSSQTALRDITDLNTIAATSLTYASDGTFSFNGSSDYIDTNNTFKFNQSEQFSVEVWLKILDHSDRPAAAAGIIGKGHYYDNQWDVWLYNNNSIYFETSGNPTRQGLAYMSSPVLTLNTWHHYVATYNNGAKSVYLNGVLVGTQTYTGPGDFSNANNVLIGRRFGDSSRSLRGSVSVAKIYNRALSAAEVQQNFNATRGRYGL